MKRFLLMLMVVLVVALAGCGNLLGKKTPPPEEEGKTEEQTEVDQEDADEATADVDEEEDVDEEDMAQEGDKEELDLQILKVDEEEGITAENNEIYQAVQAEIDADPYMGDADDFSLFPYDVVEFEDESVSVMFLAINRLDKPIRNMSFDLTLGNQDGDYIFENTEIDLPEELIGELDTDSVVPFFADITEEDVDLFYSLDMENLHLDMDNFKIDFVE